MTTFAENHNRNRVRTGQAYEMFDEVFTVSGVVNKKYSFQDKDGRELNLDINTNEGRDLSRMMTYRSDLNIRRAA